MSDRIPPLPIGASQQLMKSQWECVLKNLGEWVGSFTTISPQGSLIEDVPSIIELEGIDNNRSIHLVLKRFYALPNSTEREIKEVVWDFSTPPGIGAMYFETGAFSAGLLALTTGARPIFEFSLIASDRRFRMIQMFDVDLQLDRITFVREYRQGTTAPECPHLTIADLSGRWQGTTTTFYADLQSPIVTDSEAIFITDDAGYRSSTDPDAEPIVWQSCPEKDRSAIDGLPAARLLLFAKDVEGQSYRMLLLPDGGYAVTPTQIKLGCPFYVEIGWMYRSRQRQRLVRRYDSNGKWYSTAFVVEESVR